MTLRLGEQRPVRMRRIGARHAVVMPPQVAQLMSLDQLEQALRVAEQQERQTQAQLDRHRAYMTDLRKQIETFKALPIDRDDDDPEVPQLFSVPDTQPREAPVVPLPLVTAADG